MHTSITSKRKKSASGKPLVTTTRFGLGNGETIQETPRGKETDSRKKGVWFGPLYRESIDESGTYRLKRRPNEPAAERLLPGWKCGERVGAALRGGNLREVVFGGGPRRIVPYLGTTRRRSSRAANDKAVHGSLFIGSQASLGAMMLARARARVPVRGSVGAWSNACSNDRTRSARGFILGAQRRRAKVTHLADLRLGRRRISNRCLGSAGTARHAGPSDSDCVSICLTTSSGTTISGTKRDTDEDLAGRAFKLVTTGAIYDRTRFYLDDLYSGGTYHTGTATWLDTSDGQDQVVLTPTPEPASLTLFGSALAYTAARRRKRKADFAI